MMNPNKMTFRDKVFMRWAVHVTVAALVCELPHLLAWMLYVWARFYPATSGDVVIAPGFVQATKEEFEKIMKEEKVNVKIFEEEEKKRLKEEEEHRAKEADKERRRHQKELLKNRNILISVKCD